LKVLLQNTYKAGKLKHLSNP